MIQATMVRVTCGHTSSAIPAASMHSPPSSTAPQEKFAALDMIPPPPPRPGVAICSP
jgi:hypothetical protein